MDICLLLSIYTGVLCILETIYNDENENEVLGFQTDCCRKELALCREKRIQKVRKQIRWGDR